MGFFIFFLFMGLIIHLIDGDALWIGYNHLLEIYEENFSHGKDSQRPVIPPKPS